MSATAVRSEYAALLSSTLPAVIRSDAENARYIAMLEELDSKGNRMTAAERRSTRFVSAATIGLRRMLRTSAPWAVIT